MANPSTEEVLRNTLQNGEKVLWKGNAEEFPLMDTVYRSKIMRSIITSTVIMGAALIGYLAFTLNKDIDIGQHVVISILIVALWFFMLSGNFTQRKKLLKEMQYVITNQRALIVGKFNAVALPVNANTKCKIEKMDNGKDILYLGEACTLKPTQTRNAGTSGLFDENGVATGVVFYSISNAAALLEKYTAIKTFDRVA